MDTESTVIEQTLKQAIQASGKSVYALAKRCDIPQPSLAAYVHGKRGLNFRTAAKLMEGLGLELRPKAEK